MQENCAWCSNPADSKEHLWSNWMEGFLPESEEHRFYKVRQDGTQTSWKAKSLNQGAHVVCNACNNAWMSEIDQYCGIPLVGPMIKSTEPRVFGPTEIASLAIWGFKTAVIGNHTARDFSGYFSTTERRNFARGKKIPKGVMMWLGCVMRDNIKTGFWTSYYPEIKDPRRPFLNLYVFNCGIGRFALQFLAARYADDIERKRRGFPRFSDAPSWQDFRVPLWPSDGTPITWPPPKHLTDETLYGFIERFKKDFRM
jgi:hypothetical protein